MPVKRPIDLKNEHSISMRPCYWPQIEIRCLTKVFCEVALVAISAV